MDHARNPKKKCPPIALVRGELFFLGGVEMGSKRTMVREHPLCTMGFCTERLMITFHVCFGIYVIFPWR